ncbi:Uncharacterised protein [Lelliottia amnigena]|uniref:hypothetical protein n=1 Tax=Lelliottia TaxID=1330545 RepID=UPI000931587B|nr:hypothetical protein CO697_21135 [Lelliottia amnigena]PEG65355.1 hypothetical protein CRH15_09145 [Lelliottia amnigena]QXA20289.1 hypothetical protein I6L74_12640 [Lelliottia amnigena]CAI9402994.1 hypothetical protein CCAJJPOJ_03718 [Lelliottia sp. T2.26D-8]VDZ87684.1 Uncharacterised protein [Lelliottia amnigena]
MKIKSLLAVILAACWVFNMGSVMAKSHSVLDSEIKDKVIAESIASYPGVCACPFNRARNGSACGRRSAWSKAGGYAPLCYKNEVTDDRVKQWREQNNS